MVSIDKVKMYRKREPETESLDSTNGKFVVQSDAVDINAELDIIFGPTTFSIEIERAQRINKLNLIIILADNPFANDFDYVTAKAKMAECLQTRNLWSTVEKSDFPNDKSVIGGRLIQTS